VETVSLDPHRVESARDGHQAGNTREGPVKSGVKTCHLEQFRVKPAKSLYQLDFTGQMVRVVRCGAMQFFQ
jgi:hypothetical protein